MERTRDAASLSLYQSAAKSPEEGHCRRRTSVVLQFALWLYHARGTPIPNGAVRHNGLLCHYGWYHLPGRLYRHSHRRQIGRPIWPTPCMPSGWLSPVGSDAVLRHSYQRSNLFCHIRAGQPGWWISQCIPLLFSAM